MVSAVYTMQYAELLAQFVVYAHTEQDARDEAIARLHSPAYGATEVIALMAAELMMQAKGVAFGSIQASLSLDG
jgi:hypothetical protein